MPVYSHSRIACFENCPLQYRFRYIDELKSEVEGIEAFVGKVVHEVLEALYRDLDGARAAGASQYRGLFADLWHRRFSHAVRIVRENMTVEDYRALGERCVENFYNRYHPFEGAEVLGCETRVDFRLDGEGRYLMRGFIDRIDRVGAGMIEIHDYKTGSLPRAGSLKSDRQLTLYEIALRERWTGIKEVRHVWHYLAHDKEFVERRSPEELRRTKLATIRSIQTIEATTEFPARRSALCSWCEYKGVCPEWQGEPTAQIRSPAQPRLTAHPSLAVQPRLAPGLAAAISEGPPSLEPEASAGMRTPQKAEEPAELEPGSTQYRLFRGSPAR